MVELLGLFVCICGAAFGAGSTFEKELRCGRSVVFSGLVSILMGLSLLLVYALVLYASLFVLRATY